MPNGTRAIARALTIGAVSPLVGSRRLTRALNTVPSPMIAKVIVIAVLAESVLGSSGPATKGTKAATNSTAASTSQAVTAGRLVIGKAGSRGGRCMTSGSPGSTAMMMTPAAVAKKSRYSTMVGVIATPSLTSKIVAARKSSTSESSCVIW